MNEFGDVPLLPVWEREQVAVARVLTQKRVLVTGELPVLVMVIHDSRGLVTTERGSWTRDGYFLEDRSMAHSTGRANSQVNAQANSRATAQTNRQINRQINRRATAETNRQTTGQFDGRFGQGD